MPSPSITVLLPVYNGERFLGAAVESILGQTWTDLELLVVDDGSTDRTAVLLRDVKDRRLVVHRRPHRGLIASLNHGLDQARGEWIARMDADDVARPDRLTRQAELLSGQPEVGIVGSWAEWIDDEGRGRDLERQPATDLQIRWRCLLMPPFVHPSVMMRRSVLSRHGLRYDPAWRHVEDYELWTRILGVTHGANLQAPLVTRRSHPGRISLRHEEEQAARHRQVSLVAIRRRLLQFGLEEEAQVRMLATVVGGAHARAGLPRERGRSVRLYLEMLEAFGRQHQTRAGMGSVRRDAIAWLLPRYFRRPMERGMIPILSELSRIDPALPWRMMQMGMDRATLHWRRWTGGAAAPIERV